MYYVKIESTGEVQSMWADDWLKRAITECEMRTHVTQAPHIVTDEHNYRVHLSLPHEVKQRHVVKREERQTTITIIGVVILIIAWALWAR